MGNCAHKYFKAQKRQKDNYDRNAHVIGYNIGDRVRCYTPVTKKGKSPKLTPFWHGPFRIIDIDIPNYLIRLCDNPRSRTFWVHANRLKPTQESHVPQPSNDLSPYNSASDSESHSDNETEIKQPEPDQIPDVVTRRYNLRSHMHKMNK